MIRYYLVATLIVLLAGGIIFAHRLAPPDLRISAQPSGTPTVERHVTEAPSTAAPFSAQGPWVLSALPDCFDEQSRVSGPYAEVAGKLPPNADRIAAGTELTVASCTLLVRAGDIWVARGTDRMRVPRAQLYRVEGRLVLAARNGRQLEIRRY